MEDIGKHLGVPNMPSMPSMPSMSGMPENNLPTLDIDMDAIRAGNSDAIASSISNLQGALVSALDIHIK